MTTTALLVRWLHGHTEVEQAGATVREEGFLRAGDSEYLEDATEMGQAVLDELSEVPEKIRITVEGGFAVTVGQTVSAVDSTGTSRTWRVVGITFSHDPEGNVVRSPVLELVS